MNYRAVITDEEVAELQARNHARQLAAQKALGHHWLGYTHPKPGPDSLAPLLIASIELARAKKAQK